MPQAPTILFGDDCPNNFIGPCAMPFQPLLLVSFGCRPRKAAKHAFDLRVVLLDVQCG